MSHRRGQSTLEYAVLIIGAAMAFVALFAMIRNASNHRLKTGVDAFGHGRRYP